MKLLDGVAVFTIKTLGNKDKIHKYMECGLVECEYQNHSSKRAAEDK